MEQLLWFLSNYVTQIIDLSEEEPVFEFISSIHRNNSASGLFINSLMKSDLNSSDPVFVLKILKTVENSHPNHIGSLLKLLLPKLLTSKELSISRSVANLASRKIELLLTMSMNEVNEQIIKEDLLEIIKKMVALKLVKKYVSSFFFCF